ncbi:hypothetical protein DPMN_032275 [Dreissena polymorpha]|uniref:Uncharacterized protein n=1 Tax=Dreissena polymorpha TaxID=45954 RepID=A0A9D4RHT7_DREPO|nr:hypothetical protein DPMN_032275 [Dreissena polymorpha]
MLGIHLSEWCVTDEKLGEEASVNCQGQRDMSRDKGERTKECWRPELKTHRSCTASMCKWWLWVQ